jgi:hypothetical protein
MRCQRKSLLSRRLRLHRRRKIIGFCFLRPFFIFQRFWEPEPIENAWNVMIVGIVGLIINVIGLIMFGGGHGHSHGGGGDHGHSHEAAAGKTNERRHVSILIWLFRTNELR